MPKPKLITPFTEEVSLTGHDDIRFKWSRHESRVEGRQYYDFRLYKGYDILESTLILKKQLSYTQIYTAPIKAREATNP